MRQYLDADQFRLYDMIWKRAIASQMQPAEIERTTAEIEAVNGGRTATLRAVGSVIRFDGFIAAYTDQKEDDAEDEEDRRLPEIRAGETLKREKIDVSKHTTEPPPRYTEATLIKKMEELGIGRPSTYTAILKTLEDREYVTIDKRRLIPQAKGRLLSAFLESFFAKYVEYDFTASLEEKLDEISDGKLDYKVRAARFLARLLRLPSTTSRTCAISEVLDALNEDLAPLLFPARADGSDPRICPKCGTGKLSLRLGKSGGFIGCSNYPECNYTRQFGAESAENGGEAEGPKELGKDPYTGEEITLRIRPLRPLCPARRRQGSQALQPAQGLDAGQHRPREGAGAAVAAARCRPASGVRQDDLGRPRPLRAVRAA